MYQQAGGPPLRHRAQPRRLSRTRPQSRKSGCVRSQTKGPRPDHHWMVRHHCQIGFRDMAEIQSKYDAFYRKRDSDYGCPVEFVVRAFLGNYPRLKTDPSEYPGKRILDLGFGDGRNMPLLHNLGMQVSGVEISQDICDLTQTRMKRLGVEVDLKVGRNNSLPYEDGVFDKVLACHACYYIEPGTRFDENLCEIARVMKPGGSFIF